MKTHITNAPLTQHSKRSRPPFSLASRWQPNAMGRPLYAAGEAKKLFAAVLFYCIYLAAFFIVLSFRHIFYKTG